MKREEFIKARHKRGISPQELSKRVEISIKELAGFFFEGKDLSEEVIKKLKEELNISEESEV